MPASVLEPQHQHEQQSDADANRAEAPDRELLPTHIPVFGEATLAMAPPGSIANSKPMTTRPASVANTLAIGLLPSCPSQVSPHPARVVPLALYNTGKPASLHGQLWNPAAVSNSIVARSLSGKEQYRHAMMNLSTKYLNYVQLGGRYPRLAYGDPGRTAVGSRPAPVLDAKPSVCGLPNTVNHVLASDPISQPLSLHYRRCYNCRGQVVMFQKGPR